MMNGHYLLTLLIVIFAMSCQEKQNKSQAQLQPDFKKYYDDYQVQGSFALYDQKANQYILYQPEQFKKQYTPASTFKICNSLIGLETGVITDENFVIPWDSIVRNPVWDKNHDLKTAYRNSTVWYYQELARRVGASTMKTWLEKSNYGNGNMNGELDKFWLTGDLRISPAQQIDFLKRLQQEELPFSECSIDIVKDIMIEKDTLDYVLRAKTGWGGQANEDIGWYVGYLETKDNVYYFANCVQTASSNVEVLEKAVAFDQSRRGITMAILQKLQLIEK